MNDKREMIQPIADFLSYKIRSGEISSEGGEKIWRISLKYPEKVDNIIYILEMELPEDETIKKVEALV